MADGYRPREEVPGMYKFKEGLKSELELKLEQLGFTPVSSGNPSSDKWTTLFGVITKHSNNEVYLPEDKNNAVSVTEAVERLGVLTNDFTFIPVSEESFDISDLGRWGKFSSVFVKEIVTNGKRFIAKPATKWLEYLKSYQNIEDWREKRKFKENSTEYRDLENSSFYFKDGWYTFVETDLDTRPPGLYLK